MSSSSRGDRALPWFVLVVFLVLNGAATSYVWTTNRAADRARFDNAIQATSDAIKSRLDAYVDVLTATRGLLVADPNLPPDQLREYVRGLNIQTRFPGIQGVGISVRLPADRVGPLEQEMRGRGHNGFRVWPKSDRAEYHSIVMLEPLDRRNRAAMGFDMFTHPVRREAMERARDTGRPAASGKLTLVQEIDVRKQPGFVIYTPLYATGTTPASVELRRETLVGFIYAPFRAYDLLNGIFGTQKRPEIGFEISIDRKPLFATEDLPRDPRFTDVATIEVAGRQWTIRWISRHEGFGGALFYAGATAVGGVVIAFLLFSLVNIQLRAREHAEATAERLRESEAALLQANTAKDEFLATLSHELRTPMTAIMGWAQMLAEEKLDEETEGTAIETIRTSATAQAQLIDDLLDVSRITAGKLRVDIRPVDVAPVVSAAIATVHAAAAAKGVTIDPNLAHGVTVRGDPQRLQQIVWNLLTNAVKFTPAGGQVFVVVRKERYEAVIEVRDTGMGIDPSFMPYLFERFRQADSSMTRAHTGLGLGLAIVRHLVEMHGGTITAKSAGLGHGALFRVRLPLVRTVEKEDGVEVVSSEF